MKIGILCAVEREAAPFFPWIKNESITERAMLCIHEGTVEGIKAAVLFSGVCKVNAAIAAQILIDACACDAIIVSGTAGGMDERLEVFDTVISTEAAYHDVAQGILTQYHPWMPSSCFKADERLVGLAMRAGEKADVPGKVYGGRIVTGEQFIDKERYSSIQEEYAPLCVDMETASAAHVCYVNQIPFVAVRTVTDIPREDDESAFDVNCDRAAQISAKIVRQMLRFMREEENAEQAGKHGIRLRRADLSDAETIWRMQVKAFAPLLEKYRDFETSPGNESLERVKRRFAQPETFFYLIISGGETVGAIRVYDPQDGHSGKRISPLFVLPQHQGRGIAQAAIREAERIHGSTNWNLETVVQEAGNCYLYEKMGYQQTGIRRVVNESMTLVNYEK